MRKTVRIVATTSIFAAGVVTGFLVRPLTAVHAQGSRVFELRTYTAPEGKLDALQQRFRDHTRRIFDRHGMTSIGYWVPQDEPLKSNTLVYILAHPSRDEAKRHWAEFQADPEWKQVAADSQKDGPIVSKIVSIFMDAADYSALK
jgi:NIPSNAP protein